jgi:hypothetical protein
MSMAKIEFRLLKLSSLKPPVKINANILTVLQPVLLLRCVQTAPARDRATDSVLSVALCVQTALLTRSPWLRLSALLGLGLLQHRSNEMDNFTRWSKLPLSNGPNRLGTLQNFTWGPRPLSKTLCPFENTKRLVKSRSPTATENRVTLWKWLLMSFDHFKNIH